MISDSSRIIFFETKQVDQLRLRVLCIIIKKKRRKEITDATLFTKKKKRIENHKNKDKQVEEFKCVA